MITVVYAAKALNDLESIASHLAGEELAERAVVAITGAVEMLAQHPYIGRPIRGQLRELIISFGRTGYVALHRVGNSRVEVLAIRHQQESGYR